MKTTILIFENLYLNSSFRIQLLLSWKYPNRLNLTTIYFILRISKTVYYLRLFTRYLQIPIKQAVTSKGTNDSNSSKLNLISCQPKSIVLHYLINDNNQYNYICNRWYNYDGLVTITLFLKSLSLKLFLYIILNSTDLLKLSSNYLTHLIIKIILMRDMCSFNCYL